MSNTVLEIGTRLEMQLINEEGERILPFLVSRLESGGPDGALDILAPIFEGRNYPVHRDQLLSIVFVKNGDLYQFEAVCLERILAGSIYLLRIKATSLPEKIQRRIYFRFLASQDIKIRIYAKRGTPSKERGEFQKTVTRDISGGGMCLLLREKAEVGQYIEGILNISDGDTVTYVGKIVRVINVDDKGIFKYEVGVEFEDITEKDREKLIGFIFDSQRKLLKKGWSSK